MYKILIQLRYVTKGSNIPASRIIQ